MSFDMSFVQGQAVFNQNFKVGKASPLDARMLAPNLENLTSSEIEFKYKGMIVSITNDEDRSGGNSDNNGLYILTGDDSYSILSWTKLETVTTTLDLSSSHYDLSNKYYVNKTNTDTIISDLSSSHYDLKSSLSSYATTTSLSDYALTSSLSSYATKTSLSYYALTSSLSSYATSSSLATVATTGSFTDLSDKPSIDNAPTYGSQNHVTSGAVYDAISRTFLPSPKIWWAYIYSDGTIASQGGLGGAGDGTTGNLTATERNTGRYAISLTSSSFSGTDIANYSVTATADDPYRSIAVTSVGGAEFEVEIINTSTGVFDSGRFMVQIIGGSWATTPARTLGTGLREDRYSQGYFSEDGLVPGGTWFADKSPTSSKLVTDIISLNHVDDIPSRRYSYMWIGGMIPKTSGTYTFRAESDDQSRIYIGSYNQLNKNNLDSAFMARFSRRCDCRLHLDEGILYDIIIPYGNTPDIGSSAYMRFKWKYPGSTSYTESLDNENLRFVPYNT